MQIALSNIIKDLISTINCGFQKKKPFKKTILNHEFFGIQKPRTCGYFILNIKKNKNKGF
jgi:hypothetical protein